MGHEALMRMIDNGSTFLTAYTAAKENEKAWDGPHWLPKDVREADKTDGKACDYSNIPDRVVYAIYHIHKLLKDKSPGSDFSSLWEPGGSLRVAATRPDGTAFLVKWKRSSTDESDKPSPVVLEDDKPVPKLARTDSRPINSLPTTTSFKQVFCGTLMEFLEFQQIALAKILKKLEHDIHQGAVNLRNRRVNEEVKQRLQKGLDQSLREAETTLTLETGGASNEEARYRLEGAALLRYQMSSTTPSASVEEIKKTEDDLGDSESCSGRPWKTWLA
ncbi:hypothetical protein FVER53590_30336 [Fusarium verticillioides]|nr:hypothetical protein FVER53590_30336 [Fusarium verticillioides]